MSKKVLAIVGTYRKGRVIDTAVDAMLCGAAEHGAETEKMYLIDQHIEFCDNCRACTQKPGEQRGPCRHDDDMDAILEKVEAADGLVLASPVNFGAVTAVMKRFVERLVVYAYWPWETPMPKFRRKAEDKRAVLLTSSAAPAILGRLLMRGPLGVMKQAARAAGAKVVGTVYLGLVAQTADEGAGDRNKRKAYAAGVKLARSL